MTPPHTSPATVLPVRGAAPYQVVVGALADQALARHLEAVVAIAAPEGGRVPSGHAVARVGLLYDDAPAVAAGVHRVRRAITALGVRVVDLPIAGGERGKTAAAAVAAWEALGAAGFTRTDMVVTVGGGATTDLGGFVAATWLRGVRVVHVPTTLLAMVDAAVGGKTGVNTGAGKNLVGSFHEPAGVICDLSALSTLPRAELVSGLAEVVKCGFVADPVILDLIEDTDPVSLTADSPVLRELIERAIRVKIDVVTDDLRETGGRAGHPGREVLNYGHTLAHAIERAENYTIRHGEAVSIGCVYAAEVAARLNGLPVEAVRRHRAVLNRVGLPTTYAAASFDTVRATMAVDKKARGSELRFVLLDDLAKPRVLVARDEAALAASYAALRPDPEPET
ncbi:MAG: 3-dehydroquinate synthase [Nocardioides sp.]